MTVEGLSIVVPAVAALAGTVAGGLITFFTNFWLKRAEWRKEMIASERSKREQLYSDFMAEAGRLLCAGVDKSIDSASEMSVLYSLVGRIRMLASAPVVSAAEELTTEVINGLGRKSKEESTRKIPIADRFSTACRKELDELK